jgi:hypothetical protein
VLRQQQQARVEGWEERWLMEQLASPAAETAAARAQRLEEERREEAYMVVAAERAGFEQARLEEEEQMREEEAQRRWLEEQQEQEQQEQEQERLQQEQQQQEEEEQQQQQQEEGQQEQQEQQEQQQQEDPYLVLGVDRDATQAQLRTAYRQLSLRWHPDRNRESAAEATQKFATIAAAWERLGTPDARAVWDDMGDNSAGFNTYQVGPIRRPAGWQPLTRSAPPRSAAPGAPCPKTRGEKRDTGVTVTLCA